MDRTTKAIIVWTYNHPDQDKAIKAIRSLPNSFEDQLPKLRDLGVVTPKTYEGLL